MLKSIRSEVAHLNWTITETADDGANTAGNGAPTQQTSAVSLQTDEVNWASIASCFNFPVISTIKRSRRLWLVHLVNRKSGVRVSVCNFAKILT